MKVKYTCSILIIMLLSCKKKHDLLLFQNSSLFPGHIRFQNNTGKKIQLALFKFCYDTSNHHYCPVAEYEMEKDAVLQLPDSLLQFNISYYFDWWTADYSKSIWPGFYEFKYNWNFSETLFTLMTTKGPTE